MKLKSLLLCCVWLCIAVLNLSSGVAAKRPHIVFVTGDHEYSSEGTMPLLAAALEKHYGFQTTVLKAFPDENAEDNIPGLEALAQADVAVFFLRWRQLPKEQVEHIRRYLNSGRPVVAFRTTTHAFNYPKGHPLEVWNAFAPDYLGGPPGWGGGHYHYGHRSTTEVTVMPAAADDPLLRGVERTFQVPSWLYHVLPNYPPKDAKLLLMGRALNPEKKNAVENPVAWTWTNKVGGRVFMTTLGHPGDFQVESFQRLVVNGIHWAVGKPVPKKWPGKIDINVPYHGIRKTAEKK
ncbi:MAG: ThuA domain-containing protein [Acidobacteria bacterium]|nr:ThuA domain-containing protein [Acidobacteriota bacterium]